MKIVSSGSVFRGYDSTIIAGSANTTNSYGLSINSGTVLVGGCEIDGNTDFYDNTPTSVVGCYSQNFLPLTNVP